MILAEQAVAKKIQESYMQFVNEGNNPEQFNLKTDIFNRQWF